MSNPFRHGQPVTGDYFTGRYREKELLMSELSQGHNLWLTAPRHYGKSSLVKRVMAEFERQGTMTVYLDLDRAFSLSRLVEVYLAELLRSAFRQARELQEFAEQLQPALKSRLHLEVNRSGELALALAPEEDETELLLGLLELTRLTSEYKRRLCVVCCDELGHEHDQAEPMRTAVLHAGRLADQVSYLIVGDHLHPEAVREGFVHVALDKIEDRYMNAFIKTRFENTGYRIDPGVIEDVIRLAEGHPHFIQMICRELWNAGHLSKNVNAKHLNHALEAILETHHGYYTALWRELSLHQKNLLLAVALGGGRRIFSKAYLAGHQLGSFSTVQKSLGRLIQRRLLARQDDAVVITDLFLKRWLVRRLG